jgi:putative colanic acid biosynthesis glycosyltransferase
MSKNPVFSVITVTLDNLAGLEKTYDSIKAQSFQDLEWIVIDGGSSDGTRDFLKNHALALSEPDRGLYDAMEQGYRPRHGGIECRRHACEPRYT